MSCDTLKIILSNTLKGKENNSYAQGVSAIYIYIIYINTASFLVFQGLLSHAELSLVPSMHREALLLYTDLIR